MSTRKSFVSVVLTAIFILVLVVLFVFLKEVRVLLEGNNFIRTQKSTHSSYCQYGEMPPEMYLYKYEVKTGETLLSIANNELGSTSRVNEIVNLNKNRGGAYHSLYTSNVIEKGWELYLPLRSLPPNSGDLVAQLGKITADTKSPFTGRMLVITSPKHFPTGQPTSFTNESVFLGTDEFKVGDCVLIIRDEGTDKDILLAINQGIDTLKSSNRAYSLDEVVFPTENEKCEYNFLGPEIVMRRYQVKAGDNLASISVAELGGVSRTKEIVEANKDRYSSLKTDNFIEVGWELLLPPKWAVSTSGYLTGLSGMLIREDEESFWVSKELGDPARISFTKASKVERFGKQDFEKGDCVVVLNNRGLAIGISTQDVDYINLFKYGEAR